MHDLVTVVVIVVIIINAFRRMSGTTKPPTSVPTRPPGTALSTGSYVPPPAIPTPSGVTTPSGSYATPTMPNPPIPSRQAIPTPVLSTRPSTYPSTQPEQLKQPAARQWTTRLSKKPQLVPEAPKSQAPMSNVALDFQAQQRRSDEEFASAAKQDENDSASTYRMGERVEWQTDFVDSMPVAGVRSFSENPLLNAIVLAQVLARPDRPRRLRR